MRALLLVSILFVLVSCVKSLSPDNVLIRDPDRNDHHLSKIENGSISPLLRGVWQYGLLSASAYEPGLNTLHNFCPLRSKYSSRWKRDQSFPRNELLLPVDYRYEIKGFGYSIWEDETARGRKRVVIAFRGTDWKEPGDWYSNLRWITKYNPFTRDQYQQTRALIQELVPALKETYGNNVEIVTTGHSLGGGLAQHAAYSSRDINLVYAFATSPVTGSRSFDPTINPVDVKIFRVYEHGEILSVFRWGGRRFISLSQKDPEIKEARFNFRSTWKAGSQGGGPFSQHSIIQFSCDLICRVEKGLSEQECKTKATPR